MLMAYQRLLDAMTPHERRRFWILVAVIFVLTIFEIGSVVSILPFLRLLSEPELIQTTPALVWAYETGGFTNTRDFTIATGVLVFFVTILGLVLKMVSIWLTTRFALMRSYSFSARLLTNYLHQPYEWFLQKRSSDLGNAILSEVDRVVAEALFPAMRMIPEMFTVALLVAALCFLEPGIAIGGAIILGGVYGIIFVFVRKTLTRLGAARMAANQTRFHVVQEATGGLKELKIMGLEDGFLGRFRPAALNIARVQTRMQIIATVPRQAIEAVAFGGMIALILVLLSRGSGDMAAVVPTLGLIAAAGLRMIPALQQVYQRAVMLRQSGPVLERLHGDLTKLEPEVSEEDRRLFEAKPNTPLTDSLDLVDISYQYPEAPKPALNGLSMSIKADTTVGIVGGTGAGKTTLIDIILGLLVPEAGEMQVNGAPVALENRRSWQRTLGFVPQTIFLTDGTIAENIAFGQPKDQVDMAAVERAAQTAALHEFVMSELPDGYNTEVGERGVRLSGGQRQRVGIARALYHDPTVLIFDEATSALDTLTEAAVMDAVTQIAGTKTIIMIAHRLSTVQNCDCIHFLRHGKVAASGTFDELATKDEEFRKMAAGLVKPPQ